MSRCPRLDRRIRTWSDHFPSGPPKWTWRQGFAPGPVSRIGRLVTRGKCSDESPGSMAVFRTLESQVAGARPRPACSCPWVGCHPLHPEGHLRRQRRSIRRLIGDHHRRCQRRGPRDRGHPSAGPLAVNGPTWPQMRLFCPEAVMALSASIDRFVVAFAPTVGPQPTQMPTLLGRQSPKKDPALWGWCRVSIYPSVRPEMS